MNKKFKTWTTGLLAVAIIGTAGIVMAEENSLGAKAASQDTSYTLEEMLTYAIQDEYLAKDEYTAIIDAFDVTRPYANIIRAEGSHIKALLPLFDAYNIPVPDENAVAGQAVIPETLAETFAIGVEAEKNNIAMYESFLKQVLPDDVRFVFENLRDGSINHLAAFERGISRDGTGNRFNGNGQPARGPATDQASGRAGRGFRSDRGNRTSGGFGQQGTLENCILA
ncbi:MAG: DUF2202 domain-containing protein [Bacillota bacterium]|nr:DUF2202 domain-containing protein [Bacillota bacterium]